MIAAGLRSGSGENRLSKRWCAVTQSLPINKVTDPPSISGSVIFLSVNILITRLYQEYLSEKLKRYPQQLLRANTWNSYCQMTRC